MKLDFSSIRFFHVLQSNNFVAKQIAKVGVNLDETIIIENGTPSILSFLRKWLRNFIKILFGSGI